MRMHSAFVLAALSSFALGTEASRGDGPNLGRPINAADIAAWDYATTLFDYIRRAMPWTAPRSLTDDQV